MPRAERTVDVDLLRSLPLEPIDGPATKYQRGTALVIGGSAETPGGALLAGVAALRVGAGKLQIATVASAASALAVAVPEARVKPLRETANGAIDADSAAVDLVPLLAGADAVLVGTSTMDPEATGRLLRAVIAGLGPESVLVVDAGALPALHDHPEMLEDVARRAAVIPNPSELAQILGVEDRWVLDQPSAAIDAALERLDVVVALRDTTTLTAAPGTPFYVDRTGHPALGTSGSGDVLAGAVLGLAARGADPLRATLWAVHVHGLAGEHLGLHGPGVGALARELLAELPVILRAIDEHAP